MWIPERVRNRKAAGTISVPIISVTDGSVSVSRPGSRKQTPIAVFIRSPRGGGLRRRSSRRSDPVGSTSTNCDMSGRNLPGSLADGRLPGPVRPIRSAKHRRPDSAPPFQNRKMADPGVFGIPPLPANIPSFECRCRGNGIRERRACGAGGWIWHYNSTRRSIGFVSTWSRTVATEGGGSLAPAGSRGAHSNAFPVAVQTVQHDAKLSASGHQWHSSRTFCVLSGPGVFV